MLISCLKGARECFITGAKILKQFSGEFLGYEQEFLIWNALILQCWKFQHVCLRLCNNRIQKSANILSSLPRHTQLCSVNHQAIKTCFSIYSYFVYLQTYSNYCHHQNVDDSYDDDHQVLININILKFLTWQLCAWLNFFVRNLHGSWQVTEVVFKACGVSTTVFFTTKWIFMLQSAYVLSLNEICSELLGLFEENSCGFSFWLYSVANLCAFNLK